MSLAYVPYAAPVALGDAMDRLGVRMTFAKGEEIFGQDEDADLIYVLVEGVVRTTRFFSDGRRQIGDFYYSGDFFGLETGPAHRFCAEPLTDCVVLAVKRSILRNVDDRQISGAIWEATRRELERTQEHMLMLGRKSACERVASFLMEVAHRQEGAGGSLPMGRQDMADYLGLTIETVSRMVSQLQASGFVAFDNARTFRVTRWDALERLAA